MYLVIDSATRCYVFLESDPRDDGYEGDVIEGVTLDTQVSEESGEVDATAQVPCLGRDKTKPNAFKVFSCTKDCRQAGFEPAGGVFGVFDDWTDYSG